MSSSALQRLYRAARRFGKGVAYERIETLEQLKTILPEVSIDHDLDGIDGWLRPDERKALYALARWLPGPYLEIGSWVGLSTSIIAFGIKDSGGQKKFVTCELNPKPENYRPYEGGMGFFVPPESVTPSGVCSLELFTRDIEPIVTSPGGVIATLHRNLELKEVENLVEVSEGDFSRAPTFEYRFIFSDTMHDAHEISVNVPKLKTFLTPGCILACHDTDDANMRQLTDLIRFKNAVLIDSLFIGEVA